MKKVLLLIAGVLLLSACAAEAPVQPREEESAPVSSQMAAEIPSETESDTETKTEATEAEERAEVGDLLYPPVDVMAEGTALKTASLITRMLVPCAGLDPETLETDVGYAHFLLHWARTTGGDFSYRNIFPLIDAYNSQFYLPNCDKMIHQIFGAKEWSAETSFFTPPNGGFNPGTNAWEFATDFGCCGMQTNRVKDGVESVFSPDGTQVFSEFELLVAVVGAADPEMKSAGMYRAVYGIVTEDGETFLRFCFFEKI